jgi:type IV secretion system protein VirB1
MPVDLTTLVQQCAPAAGPHALAAIVKTESNGNPWRIGDNTTGQSFTPASQDAAVAKATELAAEGHNLDLGLGQINIHNLQRLGLTISQVFDPCTNLNAASQVLNWGLARAVKINGPTLTSLYGAISAYNTGSLTAGFENGYVQQVARNANAAAPEQPAQHDRQRVSPAISDTASGSRVDKSMPSAGWLKFASMLGKAALIKPST